MPSVILQLADFGAQILVPVFFCQVQMTGDEIHVEMDFQDMGNLHAQRLRCIQIDLIIPSGIDYGTGLTCPEKIGIMGNPFKKEGSYNHDLTSLSDF